MTKTTQIKVPANLGPLGNVILFPGYLSNGHWAIKKTRIANADLFATQASAEAYFPKRYTVRAFDSDQAIMSINNKIDAPELYTATRYLESDSRGTFRFFVNATTGELVQFDCAYLKLLQLDHIEARLFGNANVAFRDTQDAEDMTILIMPVKFEKSHLTVFQATLRALEMPVTA